MKVIAEETFAPVASVIQCDDFEESLRHANDSKFGLQVGVFTKDIDRVLKAIKRLYFGGVIINDTPSFRVDHMPYAGTSLRRCRCQWRIIVGGSSPPSST